MINLATALTILISLAKNPFDIVFNSMLKNWIKMCIIVPNVKMTNENEPTLQLAMIHFVLSQYDYDLIHFFFSPLQLLLPPRHLLLTCTTPFSPVWLIRSRRWTVPRPSRPSWPRSRKTTVCRILDMLSRYSKE